MTTDSIKALAVAIRTSLPNPKQAQAFYIGLQATPEYEEDHDFKELVRDLISTNDNLVTLQCVSCKALLTGIMTEDFHDWQMCSDWGGWKCPTCCRLGCDLTDGSRR